MGGSDTRAQAESFADAYGGPDNMLWSNPNAAWRHYQAGNPNLILLDGAGVTRIEKVSKFNRSRLQDALDGLA